MKKTKRTLFHGFLILIFTVSCWFDIIMTTRHGINFWNALLQGQITKFYSYNMDVLYLPGYNKTMSAMYNICEYFIFAIWDFPLWIYEKLTNNNAMSSTVLLVYAKSIVLLFGVGCIKVTKNITGKLSNKVVSTDVVDMMMTSSVFLSTVISMGQYDVIALFFILLGVEAYLQNKNKLFIFYFSIAIPLKLFAFFFFFPLLLLREKKIIKIIIDSICSGSIYIVTSVCSLIFDYEGVTHFTSGHLIKQVLVNNIDISLEPISLFFVFEGFILIGCYLHLKEVDSYTVIRICCIASLFTVIIPSHPQWYIYFVPFLCILCNCIENGKKEILYMFETLFEGSIMLATIIYYRATCSANMVEITWVGKWFGRLDERNNLLSVFDYACSKGLSEPVNAIMKIALAIAICCIISFWGVVYKEKNVECCIVSQKEWRIIRIVMGCFLVSLPILGYCVYV